MNEHKDFLGFSKSMLWQCLLLFLGICAGLWINRYIYILTMVFTLIVALIKPVNHAYYHLLFTMSFTVIYKPTPTSTSFFAYTVIIVGLILTVKFECFKVDRLLLIFFLFVYFLLGMGSNYTTTAKMIMGIVLLYIFVSKIEADDFKNQIMAFVLGVLGSCVIGTFRDSFPLLNDYIGSSIAILGESGVVHRFTGLNYDPNFFSMSIIFSVVLCLMLLMNKNRSGILLWIITCVMVLFGFNSYSKMFLLSIVIVGVISLLHVMRSPKKIITTIVVLAVVGTLLVIGLQKISYTDIMLKRLSDSDISTGRFDLWGTYFECLSESLSTTFFGVGLGSNYLSAGGPHNTYLESVYFVGIVGSILFCVTICSILCCRRYTIQKSIMNYLLLLVFIVMLGVLGCFTINELSFYCMLVWMGLNMSTKRTKSEAF